MARNSTKPKDDTTPVVEEEQGNTAPAAEEEQGTTTPQSASADSSPGKGSFDVGNEGTPAVEDESNAASTTGDEPFAGTHVVNTARGLNLREAPSYGAPVVEILPFGGAVQDIDPEGAPAGWLHVMAEDGKAGFVAARYVNPIKE